MYQSFYQGNPFLDLPIIGLLLFVASFAAVILWTWTRGGRDGLHMTLSQLPLEESREQSGVSYTASEE